MKAVQTVKNFIISNARNLIIYGGIVAASLIIAIPLLVWASGSAPVGEILYVPATVQLREGMRTEYLVNETIPASDYSLVLEDGTAIGGADCEAEADMTCAGVKNVNVSYQDGDTVYTGSFPVEVFGVRHISIEQYPQSYWIDADGNPVFGSSSQSSGLVVWAELTGAPDEFALTQEHPDWTTTVVLDPSLYKVESKATPEGRAFQVTCGNVTSGFAIIDNNGTAMCLPLQSMSHFVEFDNTDGGAERLTLYIEQAERNTEDGDAQGSQARGVYVYTSAQGEVFTYSFGYYLNGWSSNFLSASLNNWALQDGVDDANWGGDMRVTVNGKTFRGGRADWHFAVLDNRA